MGVIFVEYIWNYQDRSDNGQSMMKMRQDNDVTDHTSPLYTKKMKLKCHVRFNRVRSMMNTRQDNNVINRACAVYVKIELKCNDQSDMMGSITKNRQ